MKLPKSLTTVTKFSKALALILFIALPILAFYLGILYEKYNQEVSAPPLFCKQWQTVCDPNFVDENGGCAPKKVCVDPSPTPDPQSFSCPTTEYVNCMPPANSDKPYCTDDYREWAENNCPNFQVVW